MNLIHLIQSTAESNTVLLLLALVAVFVVAFKVLEMIFQTILVSALSGGFYLALTYFVDSVTLNIESLVFFTFIGGTLYTAYSLATKTFQLASTSVSIPARILGGLHRVSRRALKRKKNQKDGKKD